MGDKVDLSKGATDGLGSLQDSMLCSPVAEGLRKREKGNHAWQRK